MQDRRREIGEVRLEIDRCETGDMRHFDMIQNTGDMRQETGDKRHET